MYRIIALLIGYAFGCIQNGYFLSRKVAGIDIRDYGSGGAGMTNVTRVLGAKWGAIVLAADIAKAVLAFVLVTFIFRCRCGGCYAHPGLYAGLGVVLGHDFPFYLKFKGGKGVASTIGLILLLDWRVALIVYGVVLAIAFVSRYISIASLTMSLLIPILLAAFGHGWEVVTVTAVLGVLAWFMHRGNIKRLLTRTEDKFYFSRPKIIKPPVIPPAVDPSEPLPFPPNEGKEHAIDMGGETYARITVKTHVITKEDDAEEVFTRYLAAHVRQGDVVFISERALACTQSRAVPMADIKPRRLAKILSRFVHKSPYGIGLGIPETMEMALRECGVVHILIAAFISAIGKLFGRKGWFYRVAGSKARGIDGPCDYTLPPYNEYVVLTPIAPEKTAKAIAEALGVPVAIVDCNDLGTNLLGASDAALTEGFFASVLQDNPMGQSSEQTPCGIIRRVLTVSPD